jgi:hypothetical protein
MLRSSGPKGVKYSSAGIAEVRWNISDQEPKQWERQQWSLLDIEINLYVKDVIIVQFSSSNLASYRGLFQRI